MAAKKSSLKPSPAVEDNDDDPNYAYLQEKFTVRDIFRMFKLSLAGSSHDDSGKSPGEGRDVRLEMFLGMVRDADTGTAKEIAPVKHRQSQVDLHPTDSSILKKLFAVSETLLQKKEVLVHPVVREAYRRLLENKALPNSTLRRLPNVYPPPELTLDQTLHLIAIQSICDYYGPTKPKPKYPILPPRERPPPPPEPEPTKGKKKKKKGKRKKGKKHKHPSAPPEPFNMKTWRKEAMPVASTKLWMPWFKPKPCFQPTPAFSQPPSPPGDVPEPASYFGHFINNLGPDHLKKQRSFARCTASVRRIAGEVARPPPYPARVDNFRSQSIILNDPRARGMSTLSVTSESSR